MFKHPLSLLDQYRELILEHKRLHFLEILPHLVRLLSILHLYRYNLFANLQNDFAGVGFVHDHHALLVAALVADCVLHPDHEVSAQEN